MNRKQQRVVAGLAAGAALVGIGARALPSDAARKESTRVPELSTTGVMGFCPEVGDPYFRVSLFNDSDSEAILTAHGPAPRMQQTIVAPNTEAVWIITLNPTVKDKFTVRITSVWPDFGNGTYTDVLNTGFSRETVLGEPLCG